MFSRSHEIEPVQPIRSAITDAGIDGVSASRRRTTGPTCNRPTWSPLAVHTSVGYRPPELQRPSLLLSQLLRDRPLRQPITLVQPPDQCPVLQRDHPSNRSQVAQFSTGAVGLLSTVIVNWQLAPRLPGVTMRNFRTRTRPRLARTQRFPPSHSPSTRRAGVCGIAPPWLQAAEATRCCGGYPGSAKHSIPRQQQRAIDRSRSP